ncbi:30S ribosomal protein S6e [Candidatus Nanohalovita haloferacivicina]|uniref:30S ribosomal protein S6e n=1 Tax=Candidatus Nanohalovita haloferacivicina TaxID=2978046 RepID=UPI00325F9BEC|nr:Ribosomal protein S6E/S10 [Candidatus Nanohalobia archaeon BNXNv]
MKVTIGTTNGDTFQTEVEDNSQLIGNEVGDEIDGGLVGVPGYTLEITGGSDKAGFPMRKSIEGSERKRVLIEDGSGIQAEEKGIKQRKSVRGRTVSGQIEQLNTKVVEEGSKSVEEILEGDEEEE